MITRNESNVDSIRFDVFYGYLKYEMNERKGVFESDRRL